MENDTIAAKIELPLNLLYALLRTPSCSGGQPLIRNQIGHVLEFLVCGSRIESTPKPSDEGIGPKALKDSWVPVVGLHHQISISL